MELLAFTEVTERLVLRSLHTGDAVALHDACLQESGTSASPFKEMERLECLAMLQRVRLDLVSGRLLWGAIQLRGGEFGGAFLLDVSEPAQGKLSLLIHRDKREQGLARETMQALANWISKSEPFECFRVLIPEAYTKLTDKTQFWPYAAEDGGQWCNCYYPF